jgi:hypothetical protein
MNSTDNILINLYSSSPASVQQTVPVRDRKILVSLFRQISSGHFLTENQGKLLVKIFNENIDNLEFKDPEILSLIESPVWSKPFRQIEYVKKIYLSDSEEKHIIIEFTFNKRIRDQISKISKDLDGALISIGNKKHTLPLTEKNILTLVKGLKNFRFEIDEKLQNFYHEILEVLLTKENIFDLKNIESKKLLDSLYADIGVENSENHLLLADRKIRYQYQIFSDFAPGTLTDKIAYRRTSKLYLDKNQVSLTDIIHSLNELNRLPVLFIFSSHDIKDSITDLKNMATALESNSIADVGIYFRFDNTTEQNKIFNDLINTLKYNSKLDKNTKIVGLANNKLPKFLVKDQWKPNSIISFTNNFKNNKTSVYCDDVDLIIYYHDKAPLGDIDAIM